MVGIIIRIITMILSITTIIIHTIIHIRASMGITVIMDTIIHIGIVTIITIHIITHTDL